MFKEILYPLWEHVSFFNIFQYISFRAAFAFITALLLAFLFGPRTIKMMTQLKLGQVIRQEGPQSHLAKAGTPTMGGVLMIFSTVVSVLLWQDFHEPLVWIILLTIVGFGALGFLDDFLKISKKNSDGLHARFKFWGQILLASVVVLVLYFIRDDQTTLLFVPFVKGPLLDLGLFYIPLAVFLIVGFSNAVNLTDGLDGLCTGLMIIALIAFSLLSYLSGHMIFADYLQIPFVRGSGELTVVIFAVLGACVGFLWFNSHPAEIYMGDTGSLMLGAFLGVLALMLKKELLLVIIGGIFVMETLSVMIQVFYFKRTGKRVFKMAPIHHHFELLGWAENKVVTRFWIMGGMFAVMGLSTLKLQ
ncbi:MAG: phospho-N-acetylmuramoyl-pentapeptide-transferase [Spirochaetales bacterium]|nr:phospho-N-acetylmuramoyl-pentapeptide-transferase [Spirochaetales bacterium]